MANQPKRIPSPTFDSECLRKRDKAQEGVSRYKRLSDRWQKKHVHADEQLDNWRTLSPAAIRLWQEAKELARKATKATHDAAFYAARVARDWQELSDDTKSPDMCLEEAQDRYSSLPRITKCGHFSNLSRSADQAVAVADRAFDIAERKNSRNDTMMIARPKEAAAKSAVNKAS